MKDYHFLFKRESNNFDDILTDIGLKKHIIERFRWHQHLLIGFRESVDQQTIGYMILKYGDDITQPYDCDFSPVMGKDYIPNIDREKLRTVKSSS